jgi:hypothetical protein
VLNRTFHAFAAFIGMGGRRVSWTAEHQLCLYYRKPSKWALQAHDALGAGAGKIQVA